MKPYRSFIVSAKLPAKLSKLKELAYNYWWCWNSDAKELFIRVNRQLWEEVHHNPILLLNHMKQEQLEELAEQTDFLSFLDYIHDRFRKYIESKTWFDSINGTIKGTIAYFSMEYGINESFPNYSGGLGVLSGDHLKSASDLGLPLVGVGLLYQQGYFRQHLTQHGWQTESYPNNDFHSMPIILVRDPNGEPLTLEIMLKNQKAYYQVWKLQVGRISLYLLDSNIEKNENEEFRKITEQLYGGTKETRMQQEVLLGIGGYRALEALDIHPETMHINEGHAAFALLERTRSYMNKYKIDFRSAKQITKLTSIFTTHTPVPAGNEAFKIDMMDAYFEDYIKTIGISREDFYKLGMTGGYNQNDDFSMTILGLRLTSYQNGVSKLHGKVAREMWKDIWRCFPSEEVPIGSITNGIHTMTWIAREFTELYDRYLSPRWRTETDNPEIWENLNSIPNEEIWREKQRRRVRLVLFARQYLQEKQKAYLTPDQLSKINQYLDPDALTIGFARRFATYKRATLLFRDMDRLSAILKNPEHPVQIVLAGKAHPHDTQGKEVIQSIIQKVHTYGLESNVVFLEDYDMVIARFMVKGCDVWLNTPIRPMEASGTSGMKAAINGTLNLSILDGWWDEAYNGKNGFAIGFGEEYMNQEEQDIVESQNLYNILEQEILPTFYDRKTRGRIPDNWVTLMKETMKTNTWQYSTCRMVKEYAERYYIPALKSFKNLTFNSAAKAVLLKEWKEKVHAQWSNVEVIDAGTLDDEEAYVGKPIKVNATVTLGSLMPNDIVVQVCYGSVNHTGELINYEYTNLNLVSSESNLHYYEGTYICPDTGNQGFTVRVLPTHPMLVNSAELYLCCWGK